MVSNIIHTPMAPKYTSNVIIIMIRLMRPSSCCKIAYFKWMTSNALKIMEEKTEFIIFNSTNILSTCYTLQIGDNSIPMSHQVKILGVTLDSTMSLDGQIAATCRSSYMHIRRINTIRQYLIIDAIKH